jgi:hypothetical protein
MGRRHCRGSRRFSRATRRCERMHFGEPRRKPHLPPRVRADRKSLLLGTALASTLLLGTLLAPTPAHAVDCFAAATPPPGASGPIIVFPPVNDSITCTNTADRFNNPALPQAGAVIRLLTTGDLHFIDLYNGGDLTSISSALVAYGISSITDGDGSPVSIVNSGDVAVITTGLSGYGISGETHGVGSSVTIINSGDLDITSADDPGGILSITSDAGSPISITNSGDIAVTSTGAYSSARGILPPSWRGTARSASITAATSQRLVCCKRLAFSGRPLAQVPSASRTAATSWRPRPLALLRGFMRWPWREQPHFLGQ